MKHILRLTTTLILLIFLGGNVWGQTTASYDFSASGAVSGLNEASPGIALDANIGFGSFKNSGTSSPGIFSGQLRLYQSATKGGSIKIYASNGVTITQVIVHASDRTGPAAYTVDGGSATDLSAGTTYTMSGLTATSEVEFYQKDASSDNRIYVDDFEVTYTTGSSGPDNPNSFSASASSTSQIDLTFSANNSGNDVIIVWDSDGSFDAPTGTPPALGETFAGGTLLYQGTTSPQNHTGLSAGQTLYYKAWSYDGSDYSTGLTDDATTYTPTITVGSITAFADQQINTTSDQKTYNVSGANLIANITITPPTGFLISTTDGSGYSSSDITLTQIDGSVASTPIYVVFNPTLVQAYSDNITHTSTDASPQNVAVSGNGIFAAPVATAATSVGETVFTANWEAAAGATSYRLDVYTNDFSELINTGFEGSTSFPAGWTQNSAYVNNNSSEAYAGTYYAGMNATNDYFYTPLLSSPTSISFWVRASGSTSNNTTKVQYSTDGTNWNDLSTYSSNGSNTGDVTDTYSQKFINANLTGDYYIRWFMSARTGGSAYFDEILITAGSEEYVDGYNDLTVNGTSQEVSGLTQNTTYYYVVRAYDGTNTSVNSNEIDVTTDEGNTAPEISAPTATSITDVSAILGGNITSDGGSAITERGTVWKTSAGVTITDNKLAEGGTATGEFTHSRTELPANTEIFYRAYATNAIGTTLSAESSFTTFKAEPSAHPTGFTATANSSSEITVTWTDADPAADGYLIKGSVVSYADIAAPVDGTTEANATLVQNVASGVETYQFTGLSANTTYYFKIYPYNGSAGSINYKTDESIEQATATTAEAPAIVINEILADPDATNGDANGDGTVDAEDDEFIELYNNSDNAINISGFKIKDATNIARHTFPANSYLQPHDVVVVFGGGTPTGFDHLDVMVSSSGILGLNNSGDNITITDENDNTIVSYTYSSEGGDNQSITRDPDVTGSFVKHSTTTGGAFFSPAKQIDASFFKEPTVWSGSAKSNDWATGGNWSAGVPDGDNRVVIPSSLSTYPTISASAICNSIVMKDGATLLGGEYLTTNGIAFVEKSFNGYTGNDDGWYAISAPVSGMTMADSDFTPAEDEDDFYAYDQSENLWRNYLDPVNPTTWFDQFDVLTGYLVAYATANAGAKTYIGALNNSSNYQTNLPSDNTAWNLIGNPYPSKVTWADVTKTQVSSPKALNATTGAWEDLGTEIGIGQGIFVFAEDGTASITFETADQTHGSAAKSSEYDGYVKLLAGFDNDLSVQLLLQANEGATQNYEWQHDARYFYPVTSIPYLCAITSDEVWVSKYVFDSKAETSIIPIQFTVTEDQEITFSVEHFEANFGISKLTIEDTKLNKFVALSDGNIYTFTATTGDDPLRFKLHAETTTGIHEATIRGLSIYTHNNSLYFNSDAARDAAVNIYNVTGQQVYGEQVVMDGLTQINPNLKTGWYVVKVNTDEGMASEKVFIK